jgi:dTDP-4-dehydrorhamnose reductase
MTGRADTGPILVAGRAGQLARALIRAAGRAQVPLIAAGRPELDLTDADRVGRVIAAIRPSAIINAAGYTAVDLAESEPERASALNLEAAARLAVAAWQAAIPLIHLSTDYVFDGRKPSPYHEDDQASPLNAYGRSKLAGEQAVRDACPTAVVLRTSWVYGPAGRNFLRTMLDFATTRDVVRVVDDQHGAPTAAADLAGAILTIAIAADPGRAGLYHLTASGETTWHGFAAAIFAGWRERGHRVPRLMPISSADYPTAARRPANSRLDCSRVAASFGIRLPHWQASLAACLDEIAGARAEAS